MTKHHYLKQYISLASSSFLVLLAGFAANILMTQMLAENEYGTYKFVLNIVVSIASLANLGIAYSTARILTVADNDRARDLYGATIGVTVIICAAAMLIAGIGNAVYCAIAGKRDYMFFLAAVLLYTVLFQRTFVTMLKGSNRIQDISAQTLMPQVLLLACYGALWIVKPGTGLAFAQALAIYAGAYAVVHLYTTLRLKADVLKGFRKEIGNILSEQKTNGFQIYKGSLISVFSADLLLVIVGAITAKADYAVFTLALSLSMPVMQIPTVMGVIFYKQNAAQSSIEPKKIALTAGLSAIALAVLNAAVFVLFPVLYGSRYHGTTDYVLWLSIGFAFHGFGDYFNNFLSAHGRGAEIKRATLACGISLIVLAGALIPFFSIAGLVVARILSSLTYFIYMLRAYRTLSKAEGRPAAGACGDEA